jgi:4-hydroxy-tetrahydrodipicolinate synthase
MLSIGGSGVVSVASHLVGDQIQAMVKAYQIGQPQLATEIHLKLLPLFKILFVTTNPIPVKLALALQGWAVGKVRLPLCYPDNSLREKIQTVLKKSGLPTAAV